MREGSAAASGSAGWMGRMECIHAERIYALHALPAPCAAARGRALSFANPDQEPSPDQERSRTLFRRSTVRAVMTALLTEAFKQNKKNVVFEFRGIWGGSFP